MIEKRVLKKVLKFLQDNDLQRGLYVDAIEWSERIVTLIESDPDNLPNVDEIDKNSEPVFQLLKIIAPALSSVEPKERAFFAQYSLIINAAEQELDRWERQRKKQLKKRTTSQ